MGKRKTFGFHLREEDDRSLFEFLEELPQRSDWLINAARMAYSMQQLGIQIGHIHTQQTCVQETSTLDVNSLRKQDMYTDDVHNLRTQETSASELSTDREKETITTTATTTDDSFRATMREGALSFMED